MSPRASAQAIPRGTDKPKPAADQRKSPRPTALARLRHDGFATGGRPVSRKGGLPSGRVPRLPDASCGCTRSVTASSCARRLPDRLTRRKQNGSISGKQALSCGISRCGHGG